MKNDPQDTIYYPLSLNITGRKCLVVGGGQVALRKVESLLEHGAIVEVVSPEQCTQLEAMTEKNQITSAAREFLPQDLDGVFVAIAATDDAEVNHKVAAEARKRSVLVNVVDDAEYCDFIAPSYIRRGAVSIAISTSGKSPALARKLREKLEEEFGEEYAWLANLLNEVRTEVLEQKLKISGENWQEAIDLDSLTKLLKKGERELAMTTVLEKLKVKQRSAK